MLIPLLIPLYPLPAVLAALLLDGVDQTIFQVFTNLPLDSYQSYDKALDIYYLAIAYISTLGNWANLYVINAFLSYWPAQRGRGWQFIGHEWPAQAQSWHGSGGYRRGLKTPGWPTAPRQRGSRIRHKAGLIRRCCLAGGIHPPAARAGDPITCRPGHPTCFVVSQKRPATQCWQSRANSTPPPGRARCAA